MDNDTRAALYHIGQSIEAHTEALRVSAGSVENLRELCRHQGARIRGLETRVAELERPRLESTGTPSTVPVFATKDPRRSRRRIIGEWVEVVLVEICRHPYAAIVLAVLLGLAAAAIQAEFGG